MEASSFLYDSFFPQLPVASDNFVMEDFLNIPNDDTIITDDTSSSSFTSSSSSSIIDAIFPGKAFSPVTSDINFAGDVCIPDLSVPCDDLPEREWLLNIVEETFSSEELQKMELISGMRARNDDASESMWEMEPIPYVNGQNDDTLVTLQEMELVSDVKARNDDASKNMWEMELISDVREQNNDTLVTLQEMELISDVKTQKEDALEIVQNIDVKARNDDALETVQNREPILGVEAEIQHASKTVQKMEVISCTKGPNDDVSKTMEKIEMISHVKGPNSDVSDVFVPAKSRSKRPCGPPSDWISRLLLLSPTTMSPKLEPMPEPEPELELDPKQRHESLIPTLNQPSIGVSSKKPTKSTCRRKENNDGGSGGDGRRCLHCATDKTPQWRTGPMGPKTLCNACGVRYKSGRLVPEYRPAASPTFVMAKHSNSHRKVLELRRQKEMEQVQHHHHHHQQEFFQHHHHPNEMFDMNISNLDGCLIYQHVDPNFRQLI